MNTPHGSTVWIYLIHFEKKISHAQHYVGATRNLKNRLSDHAKGDGAKITAAARSYGIEWRLARLWKSDSFSVESQIKKMKNGPKYCPICNEFAERVAFKMDEFPIDLLTFVATSQSLRGKK